jgi:hypothetical protein
MMKRTMIPLKILPLLCWFIYLPHILNAQQFISGSSANLNFRVPYRTMDEGFYRNGNAVLREMAKFVVREPWQVRIQISYRISLNVNQQDDKTQLSVYFCNAVLTGDNEFRRFPVSDVMLPTKINFKLKWANRFDTTSFTEAAINGRSIDPRDSLVGHFPIAVFDPTVDTLMIRDAELYYDSAGLIAFMSRLDLIHDYYASISLLDSLERMAAGIHLDDPSNLPGNYFKVDEINKVIELIKSRDFQSTLLRSGFDPGRFTEKFGALYRQSRSFTYTFLDELKKTTAIPWNRNEMLLADEFTGTMLSYIHRSKLMDQLQGRIYQDILDHYFDNNSFPPGENVFAMLVSAMYPDARKDTIAGYFSGRIYQSYSQRAKDLMTKKQYSEAFSVMDNARRFAAKNPPGKGVSPESDLLSKAAYGIYNSYTGIAQECIRNRKYNMADTYLVKADQYAREHAALIASDSLYHAAYSELFFLRNTECDLILNQLKFAEALACYQGLELKYSSRDLRFVQEQLDIKKNQARAGLFRESVLKLQDALTRNQEDTAVFYFEQANNLKGVLNGNEQLTNVLDSMAPAIGQIRYRRYFSAGAQALEYRQYTLALTQFNEAKSLAGQYGLVNDSEFDSLYRRSVKFSLIIQLSAAQKKIWTNQFDSAYLALSNVQSKGKKWGLNEDPDFKAATRKFELKIKEQQCRNLRDSVNLQMIRADRSIALKNYMNASIYLQQALEFTVSGDCGFQEKFIRDTLQKYSRAAAYQQRLSDALSHVASGFYAEAILALDENEKIYQQARLDRFGIALEGVYDFVSQRANPYLTEQAISFYQARGNNKEAMRFLRLLRIQGFSDRITAPAQSQLGKTLAMDDYLINPQDTVMRLVEQYTSNDAWFNVFRTSYLNEWNRLMKTNPVTR